MILAGVMDYLHWWQVFPMLGFLGGWLIGGPYLTRRTLTKYGLARSKRRLGECMRVNFLATLAGLVAAGIIVLFAAVLASKVEALLAVRLWVLMAAFVVGLVAMLGMSWAVQGAMVELSGKELRGTVLHSVGPLVLALLVCSLAALIPARMIRLRQRDLGRCRKKLLKIQEAVERYATHHTPYQAPSLEAMVKEGLLTEADTRCPGRREDDCGYLYAPVAPDARGRARHEQEIRACDRRGNHRGVRFVLYSNGRPEAVTEEGFQQLLELECNADIAAKEKADQ